MIIYKAFKEYFAGLLPFILIVSLLSVLNSCNDTEDLSKNTNDLFEVTLCMGNEFLSYESYEQTLINENDYYEIIVYRRDAKEINGEYKKYSDEKYSKTQSISVFLDKGYVYRFECYIVGNKRNDSSMKDVEDTKIFDANEVLYYGAYDDFQPDKSLTVEIPMYRIGYGLKLKAEDLLGGTLEIRVPRSAEIMAHNGESISELAVSLRDGESLYKTFADGLYTIGEYPDWKERILGYKKESDISFVLKKTDGTEEMFDRKVTFKRNVLTVLSVTLRESQIILNMEDSELTEEEEYIFFSSKEWDEINIEKNL